MKFFNFFLSVMHISRYASFLLRTNSEIVIIQKLSQSYFMWCYIYSGAKKVVLFSRVLINGCYLAVVLFRRVPKSSVAFLFNLYFILFLFLPFFATLYLVSVSLFFHARCFYFWLIANFQTLFPQNQQLINFARAYFGVVFAKN